jgi:hypothetical protein
VLIDLGGRSNQTLEPRASFQNVTTHDHLATPPPEQGIWEAGREMPIEAGHHQRCFEALVLGVTGDGELVPFLAFDTVSDHGVQNTLPQFFV